MNEYVEIQEKHNILTKQLQCNNIPSYYKGKSFY